LRKQDPALRSHPLSRETLETQAVPHFE